MKTVITIDGIKILKDEWDERFFISGESSIIYKFRYVDQTNLHFMELSHIPYYGTILYDDTEETSEDLGGLSFDGFMDKVKQLKDLS